MPTGKATLIPAMEIAAAKRMLAALKTTPPKRAEPMLAGEAWARFLRKLHSPPPKEPAVRPLMMANRTTPKT